MWYARHAFASSRIRLTIEQGFFVGHYFVIILAWIMTYFRNSFKSPLPWEGRGQEFYMEDVVANVDPVQNGFYLSYPGTGMVGETVGWTAFTWFLVWLCIFRGRRM